MILVPALVVGGIFWVFGVSLVVGLIVGGLVAVLAGEIMGRR